MIWQARELTRILRNGRLSEAKLVRLRNAKLRRSIRHAYENVPYYRERFAAAGITPADIRSLADLRHVPQTTKADLVAAGAEAITATSIHRASGMQRTTSGSTGSALTVLTTPRDEAMRRFVQFRALLMTGMGARDRLAVLGAIAPHHPRIHQRLGLYPSTNIAASLSIDDQIAALAAFQPTVLWTYATTLRPVLDRLDYKLSRVVRPWGLLAVAEVLDELTRERIVADYDVEIFGFYGATEVGIIATECRNHRGLHVHADHVVLEVLPDDASADLDDAGVATVTTLNALAMPMIRYRIGDVLTTRPGRCPCGSLFPLVGDPEGRDGDFVVLPSGRTLTPRRFDALQGIREIAEYQLVQDASGGLTLKLVVRAGDARRVVGEARALMLSHLDEPVALEVCAVEALERSGVKLRTFVSTLPRERARASSSRSPSR